MHGNTLQHILAVITCRYVRLACDFGGTEAAE